jgi:two-component system phosphate regulon sensor histidine kinase PhoR
MASHIEQLFDSVAAEHARLEAVFDASDDAMVALSADTSVRFLNPAAVAIFGNPMAESIGRAFIETARDYELDALVRGAVRERTGQTAVITFGPRRIPLRAAALPIRDGGDWAVLLVLTDLTEVQRIDAVRRDFLSNVSHELRTPLAAIRALVETMQDGFEPQDGPEFLGRINQQVERLTTLVNELLDLSRIESGAINLRPEQVDVGAVVAEAASLLRPRTEAAGVEIRHEGGPATIVADRASVLRIVSNLLDNATKWTPPGSTVTVRTEAEGPLVAITVEDEGPGIPEQDIPRVFERFYKGEASRANPGVGLGLAIVKHLARAHGGTATVESAPGQGAKFTVRLPRTFVGRRQTVAG